MLRNSSTVWWRTVDELLRVPADDISGNDDAEWWCVGEWP